MNRVQTRESCRRRVDETRVNRREAAAAGAGSRDTADGAVRKWTRETLGRRTGHPHPPVTCGTGGSTGPHAEPRPWGVGEGTETQARRWTPRPCWDLAEVPTVGDAQGRGTASARHPPPSFCQPGLLALCSQLRHLGRGRWQLLAPAPWRGLDTQPAAHGLRSPPGGSQCSGLGGEESSHLCCFFNKEGGLPGPTSRKNSSVGSHVPALDDELLQTEHHVAPKDTDANLNQHCLKRAPKGPFQGHRCAVGLFKHRSNGPITAYDSVFS